LKIADYDSGISVLELVERSRGREVERSRAETIVFDIEEKN
jgi:hypothetical protein